MFHGQPPNMPPFPPPLVPDDDYDVWTRRPIIYLPVVRNGELIGYLWAGINSNAASYMRRMSADTDNITAPEFWRKRLMENFRNRLTPEQAIQHWIGVPPHPRCGGIPTGAIPQHAPSKQALWEKLNPEGPPLGEGPMVQDGEFSDGTPLDRSKGWSTPHSVPTPTYSSETTSPVHYLPVTKNGKLTAYLWASPTEQAAGYLPCRNAGRDALTGAGLWRSRLSHSYSAGHSALAAIRYCRTFPYDHLSGVIGPNAPEHVARNLDELRGIAGQ